MELSKKQLISITVISGNKKEIKKVLAKTLMRNLYKERKIRIYHKNKEVDYNQQAGEFENETIEIRSSLRGGSTNLAFINIHGAPSGSRNSDKATVFQQFTSYYDVITMLETGTTKHPPDAFNAQ